MKLILRVLSYLAPSKGKIVLVVFVSLLTSPQHKLTEIKEKHTVKNLFIAAHPFEKVPFMQKLTLRRGSWNKVDYKNGGIEFLQIINSSSKVFFGHIPRKLSSPVK